MPSASRVLYRTVLAIAILSGIGQLLLGIFGLQWGGVNLFSVLTFGAMFGTVVGLILWRTHPRLALRLSGVCALVVWISLSWHNYKLCSLGPCQTHDPGLIVLTTLMVPPVLLSLLAWAFLLLAWRIRLGRRRRRRKPRTTI